MGLLGKLENVGKAVWDTGKEVSDVVEGAAAIGDFIKRVRNLRVANAPILDAGQLVIAGIKLTTGLGAPEDGERFGRGGARLHDACATLRSALPTASWTGAGADSYTVHNVEQIDRSRAMAAADHQVRGVLATEAFQVSFHRDRLDDWYNWLADVGLVTFALGLIPGVGQGMKAAADAQAVLIAVGRSSSEVHQLSSEVGANAAALQQLVGRYENLGQTANISQTGQDQNPPALPAPPSAPHEQSPKDRPGDEQPEDTAPTPPAEQPPGNPAQFVAAMPTSGGSGSGGGSGPPAMSGPPPAASVGPPAMAAPPGRKTSAGGGTPPASGAPPAPLGGMPPAPMSAAPAPMTAAPGIPVELIKETVQAALQREAERQAAEDEKDKDKEDEDGDGKPDLEKDHEKDRQGAAPGGIDAGRAPVYIEMEVDVERLATPITVTVDRENPIGPPPAPAP
jgi:hypothetical protein